MQLDPTAVYEALYERIAKDCVDAQEHISVTDIIGILEMIKMTIFTAYNTQIAQEISEAMREGMPEC